MGSMWNLLSCLRGCPLASIGQFLALSFGCLRGFPATF
jgi:hypothetical protein